jgi:hypothetical protein
LIGAAIGVSKPAERRDESQAEWKNPTAFVCPGYEQAPSNSRTQVSQVAGWRLE